MVLGVVFWGWLLVGLCFLLGEGVYCVCVLPSVGVGDCSGGVWLLCVLGCSYWVAPGVWGSVFLVWVGSSCVWVCSWFWVVVFGLFGSAGGLDLGWLSCFGWVIVGCWVTLFCPFVPFLRGFDSYLGDKGHFYVIGLG